MAQLVARLYGIEEVASSNLAGSTHTKKEKELNSFSFFVWKEIKGLTFEIRFFVFPVPNGLSEFF